MDRIEKIQARLAEIRAAIDAATGEELIKLETEARGLMDELKKLEKEAEARQKLRDDIAASSSDPAKELVPKESDEVRAAKDFVATNRMTIKNDEARAVMMSSGNLIKPKKNQTEIEEIPGAKVSSIIDLVHVEDCTGMSSYEVPYVNTDPGEAGEQTEGQAGTVSELADYKYVTIQPTNVLVLGQITKQAKKQTNVQYASKVQRNALLALRKKGADIVTKKLKASSLVKEVEGTKIDAGTLRKLALNYGDDESVLGNAYLFLNKKDLIALGDVRGTNEKKAIYEITPNADNPNTGVIKEGGLSVRYVINSKLDAASEQGKTGRTMFYGAPSSIHVGLFSDYEVKVSEDFAFDKLMDTIRGDVEMGADVCAKHSFVAFTIPTAG